MLVWGRRGSVSRIGRRRAALLFVLGVALAVSVGSAPAEPARRPRMLTRKFRKETGLHIPFRKPRVPGAETRHLYCTNCPEWAPAEEGEWRSHPLVQGLAGHCAVQGVFTVSGMPLAYLSFADAAEAAAARVLLTAEAFLPGRPSTRS